FQQLDLARDVTRALDDTGLEASALDMEITESLEYGLVTEWVNGLDSLQSALGAPEVIEDDGD
ncbi:MAG: DUF2150 family protein, partial [Halobacteriales archaeon]|nr:DUF2150 family protein [Halobacteriales archaeon]